MLNTTNADLFVRKSYQLSVQQLRKLHLQRDHHHKKNCPDSMHPYIAVPATLALVYRAYSRKSLTPLGIVVAGLTAVVHAIHPWSLPFALLVVFFLAGTAVTKVRSTLFFSWKTRAQILLPLQKKKRNVSPANQVRGKQVHHAQKAHLTLSATGLPGGEGPRTHIQVLANSLCASVLILLHARQLSLRSSSSSSSNQTHASTSDSSSCWAFPSGHDEGSGDVLLAGIIANYAAVAADTFSSELGILSRSKPRLLTSWTLREVPPGTNGGVSGLGTAAGFAGAAVIALTAVALAPFCAATDSDNSSDAAIGGLISGIGGHRAGFEGGSGWGLREKAAFVAVVTVWGGLGSLLDSALGGWFQESVVDSRTGKVVEGAGGKKVLVKEARIVGYPPEKGRKKSDDVEKKPDGRRVESGKGGLLDNNAVNLLMAACMSVGGMLLWVGVESYH